MFSDSIDELKTIDLFVRDLKKAKDEGLGEATFRIALVGGGVLTLKIEAKERKLTLVTSNREQD